MATAVPSGGDRTIAAPKKRALPLSAEGPLSGVGSVGSGGDQKICRQFREMVVALLPPDLVWLL